MKYHFIFLVATVLSCSVGFTQYQRAPEPLFLLPITVEVSDHYTTNIIFHYRVKNVNISNPNVAFLQPTDSSIQIWATKPFSNANLSVFTSDGRLTSCNLSFFPEPRNLSIILDYTDTPPSALDLNLKNDLAYSYYANLSLTAKRIWHPVKDKNGRMAFSIEGIYVKENLMFMPVLLHNSSLINYDCRDWNFYIGDKKRAKRVATQKVRLEPIYTLGDVKHIHGESAHTVVFVFEKFTIPGKREFAIELSELGGGRNLRIAVPNRKIVRATTLP